jgi:glycosyltransferase involved in cell wall biosynthesis
MIYDIVFVTQIPAFYKVNLFNELSGQRKILVIFLAADTLNKRGKDFTAITEARFDYEILSNLPLESNPYGTNIRRLSRIIRGLSTSLFVVTGWDRTEFWYCLLEARTRNFHTGFVLESNVYDSEYKGIKKFAKQAFLGFVEITFASGSLQLELLRKLNYKKKIILTRGVGIIRKAKENNFKKTNISNKLIYIGRLAKEKNLETMIKILNDFKNLSLDVFGAGPNERYLRSLASDNVRFMGPVSNSRLSNIFPNYDYLVLPSKLEPWGLVAEEALYYQTPVILTDRCGVADLVSNGINGYLYDFEFFEQGVRTLLSSYHVLEFSGDALRTKDEGQVCAYVSNC